jgi:hypothetical protein
MMSNRGENVLAWAQSQDWPRVGCVIVVGGSLPEAIPIIKAHSPIVDVVVFDPDCEPHSEENVYYVNHMDDLSVRIQHRRWPHLRVVTICPPEHDALAGPVGNVASEAVRLGEVFYLTGQENALRWMECGLNLLPKLHGLVPLSALDGACKGGVGVLVASGPSLDKSLDVLREIQGMVTICATNSATRALEEAGIYADVVCAVEAREQAYWNLASEDWWQHAIWAPGIHTHPMAWEVPAGRTMPIMQAIGSLGRWIMRKTGLPGLTTGGSVATLCYEVLRTLGCSTIVAVGFDCAYGPADNMRAYATNAGIDVALPEPDARLEFPAWGGEGMVISSGLFGAYRHWMGQRPRLNPDIEHYNASEGGAHVDNWVDLKLRPSILEDCVAVPPDLLATAALKEPLDMTWAIPELETQLDGMDHAEEVGREIVSASSHMLEAMKGAIGFQNHSECELTRNASVTPLNDWRWLPTPMHMKAGVANGDRLVRTAEVLRPKLERAIEALRGCTNARAA